MGKTYSRELSRAARGASPSSPAASTTSWSANSSTGRWTACARHGVPDESVDVAWVPGGFEIPLAAKRLADSGRYDAVICLGCLIQGDTPHFSYIAAEVTKGVAQTAMSSGIPVTFGVITADTLDQAIERAGTKAGNKGFDAALSALEMIDLWRSIDEG